MQTQVRGYRPEDFETLYQIDQACFPPGVSYSRHELGRFIRHRFSKAWVAWRGHDIIGFLILEQEPLRAAHIVTIDVVESHRRGGVGSCLMDVAEDWATGRKLKGISLETAEENRPAQLFYAARGYAKVGEIADYYANGSTAWVMVKELQVLGAARKAKGQP